MLFFFEMETFIFPFVLIFTFLWTFLRFEICPRVMKKIYPQKSEEETFIFLGYFVSYLHAFFCVAPIFPIYFSDASFYHDQDLFHVSFFVDILCCFSIGYMLSDLIVLMSRPPRSEYYIMLVHHLITLVAESIILSKGVFHLAFLIQMCAEGTTLFMDHVFFLKYFHLREHFVFKLNGFLILVFWVFLRFGIVGLFFPFVIVVNWERFVLESGLFVQGFVLLMIVCLDVMNVMWFYKLLRGFVKILKGKTVTELEEDKKEE